MDGGPDGNIGSLLLFAVLLFCSAYFSGTEISLASVNRIHMMTAADNGDKKAERVLYLLDHFEETLSVLLIGNNIVNIGCATLSAVIATEIWGTRSVSIATVLTTVIIFLFGEMLPKCFARSCNEHFARTVSTSLFFLMKIMKPLSVFFTGISRLASRPFQKHLENEVTVTEDELHDLVESISEDGDFDQDTGRLVRSALVFDDLTAQDIMVPWEEVLKISAGMKTNEVLALVRSTGHSRIPIIDRKGKVKGILQIRRFLKAYLQNRNNVILARVSDYPLFVAYDQPINELLTYMSNRRRNLAIVRDEVGTVLGIVTVEDILEQLVGEIYDEDDIGGEQDA
ncbi:MAG: HlyC/CorC family transporter [Clostridia bacterium]|nr:HlyC/CorC family transporter [Clostridia bacterium]